MDLQLIFLISIGIILSSLIMSGCYYLVVKIKKHYIEPKKATTNANMMYKIMRPRKMPVAFLEKIENTDISLCEVLDCLEVRNSFI